MNSFLIGWKLHLLRSRPFNRRFSFRPPPPIHSQFQFARHDYSLTTSLKESKFVCQNENHLACHLSNPLSCGLGEILRWQKPEKKILAFSMGNLAVACVESNFDEALRTGA